MDHKGVFARKPVADIIATEGSAFKSLPKVLGAFSITAMDVGAIIGAGIFVLTGTAAALYAGPALTISFVLAAIACGLSACAMPSRRCCRCRARPTPTPTRRWASSPPG